MNRTAITGHTEPRTTRLAKQGNACPSQPTPEIILLRSLTCLRINIRAEMDCFLKSKLPADFQWSAYSDEKFLND